GQTRKPVLVIDWDLEAPGLHRYFCKYIPSDLGPSNDTLEAHPGVIDAFYELRERIPTGDGHAEHDSEQVREWVHDVGFDRFIIRTSISNLHMMKAGAYTDAYPERVSSFDWPKLYRDCPNLMRVFVEYLTTEYSYVLIDSRTGLTDTSGICTMLLPEVLVLVFSPNEQSIQGLRYLAGKALEYRAN